MQPREPWKPSEATERLRKIGKSEKLTPFYKRHAKEQMRERDLLIGDVLYILKHGFVHDDPEPATQKGYFKYCMECRTPNSGARVVRIVVIPDEKRYHVKIVTVMWVDET